MSSEIPCAASVRLVKEAAASSAYIDSRNRNTVPADVCFLPVSCRSLEVRKKQGLVAVVERQTLMIAAIKKVNKVVQSITLLNADQAFKLPGYTGYIDIDSNVRMERLQKTYEFVGYTGFGED